MKYHFLDKCPLFCPMLPNIYFSHTSTPVMNSLPAGYTQVFHKLAAIGNNDNIGIRGFTTWRKIQQQNVTLVSIEPGTSTIWI